MNTLRLLSLLVVSLGATVSANLLITEAIVESIKLLTDLWEPLEVLENPLANYTDDQLKALLGTIIPEERNLQWLPIIGDLINPTPEPT
jgi:hypothetical protein